jgi:hypothetical protein
MIQFKWANFKDVASSSDELTSVHVGGISAPLDSQCTCQWTRFGADLRDDAPRTRS